jgi:quinol monooxygenase YgiN
MHLYQLKLVIHENKVDEFVECLLSLVDGFRQEEGCLDFKMYRDIENENTFIVVGEWKTNEAMKKHFKSNGFSVLTGAAKVLGEQFEINIGEAFNKGSFELAKELISQRVNKAQLDK